MYEKLIEDLKKKTTHWDERYSPNLGYEPYWVSGDWVYIPDQDFITTKRGETTTTIVEVCGEPCDFMYRKYMETCTVQQRGWFDVTAHTVDHHYRTFPTYCEMLAFNCKLHRTPEWQYLFVHLGKCEEENDALPGDHRLSFYNDGYDYYWKLTSRKNWFLSDLSNRWESYSIRAMFGFWIPTSDDPRLRSTKSASTRKNG